MKKSFARTVLTAACGAATLAVGILAHSGQTARSAEDNVGTAVGTPGVLPATPAPTAVQLETVLDRASLALTIVDRVAPEAKARGLDAAWRQSMIEALLTLGEDRLRSIERDAATLDVVSETLATTPDDPTTLGDPLTDFTFTPITPCRYIDTRNAGGKIAGVRTYRIDQTGAPYGGSGACDLLARFGMAVTQPLPLAALALNVTIVDTSSAGAPGFLAVKPSTSSPTTSLLNWYDAGADVQVANQAVVAINQLSGGGPHFAIETSGAVHVIVDVFGGFIAPQTTAIQTSHLSTPLIPVGVNDDSDIATASCPSGYSLIGGGCFTDHVAHSLLRSAPFGEAWSCASQNNAPSPSFVRATAICGRIPGR